jgi:SAM-dependent methyltransferase
MKPIRCLRQLLLLGLLITAACADLKVQTGGQPDYQPEVNQPGKDVVWWPTAQQLADKMLDMAKVTSEDYVIDLGSGDGRVVITASKRGSRALGIEYNPDLVALSKRNAVKEGVGETAQFVEGDIFKSDFSQATVITMFLSEKLNLKLRPRILNLKPGTRVVSNTFPMGKWTADETFTMEGSEKCSPYCTAYLWIVPAQVEGTWKLSPGELRLKQTFQTFSGTLDSGAHSGKVLQGRLIGDQISFRVGEAHYTGRVTGGSMQGTFTSGGGIVPWQAARLQ